MTVGKVESRGVAEAGLVESKLAGAAIEEYKPKMFGVFLADMELGDVIPFRKSNVILEFYRQFAQIIQVLKRWFLENYILI